jgi:hypothetical protein
MDGDYVGFREQCVEVYIGSELPALVVLPFVVSDDVHAQSACDCGGVAADVAEADDAHGEAFELDLRIVSIAEIDAVLPLAGMYGIAVISDVVACFEEQSDGELGNGSYAVDRNVAYGDALALRVGDVDYRVTGGDAAYELNVGACVEDLLGERGLVGENDVSVADAFYCRFESLLCTVINDKFVDLVSYGSPAQISGIFAITVKTYKFHNDFSSSIIKT